MPDPQRLLHTIERAVAAFRSTPGRSGRLVRISGPAEVLVTGDLHGHIENFRRILLAADLGRHPDRHVVLQELVHGPYRYPDGSDKSHQLIDLLAALKCQFPNRVHMLLGNHELAQWRGQTISKSAGELTASFRQGVQFAYPGLDEPIYQAYLELFAAVPLAVRTENRVFVSHSLPSEARADAFQLALLESDELPDSAWRIGGAAHAIVWGRDTDLEHVTRFLNEVDGDFLITGHIAAPAGFDFPSPRQLILDSSGPVAAYCLVPSAAPVSIDMLRQAVKIL